MKILFFSNSNNNSGSHRIWVSDYHNYFKKNKIFSVIYTGQENIDNFDVLIFGKASKDILVSNVLNFKSKYPDKLIGIINPPADFYCNQVDFVIAGSIEEQDSLSHFDNVFLVPLIERMYMSEELKEHKEKDKLKLCFHGSYTHLSKFETGLKLALEQFQHEQDFELIVITDKPPSWSSGRPHIKNIVYKQWGLNTIKDDIKDCDIGLIPNMTSLNGEFETSVDKGLYNTDYICRFKNKSNAGRCFVFHQLGIPVIADITPSNLHILGNPDNGFAVYNKNGWLKALKYLSNAENRGIIAKNAHNEFNRLYNPYDWAKKLYNQILEIKNGNVS